MAERVLGLDVGTSAVRVVEVVLSSPPAVSRVGEVPLPPGAVRDGEVIDAAAVGAAITELWRQTGLRSRDVRVGLTGSRVVVRVIDMPAMPDEELAGAVRFSASDHIPIPLEEAVLDHAVLEPAPPAEPGGPPQVQVLLVAAYRSPLDALPAATCRRRPSPPSSASRPGPPRRRSGRAVASSATAPRTSSAGRPGWWNCASPASSARSRARWPTGWRRPSGPSGGSSSPAAGS